ncbi:Nucleophosmin [Myotis brandtii]|uniref:Nucleophosmin n=1 Tax=Myotis brandtii TaxID=109478 RepID=S7N2P2_MYOBR|nr:Nucleophosmin [Myotis brandtii]
MAPDDPQLPSPAGLIAPNCPPLQADKDYHFKVDNDENEHQLSLRTVSLGAGAKDELHIVEAEAMNYEGSPIKVTLATLKMSVQPTEAEEKAPVKKSIRDTPAKNAQKSNQNGKDSKPSTPRSKGQESFKKQEKTPKTPKGPSSVEDIKAKMQASIEKGGSLPKVEAKFINYVKNCFRMTDVEAIQDLWQWRKSL